MDNYNTTKVLIDDDSLPEWGRYVEIIRGVYYTFNGGFYVVSATSIVATLLFHKALRRNKHYLMLVPLFLFFLQFGLGNVAAGFERLPHAIDYTLYTTSVPVKDCLVRPSLWLWHGTLFPIAVVLLVLAVDRLYLVVETSAYTQRTITYVVRANLVMFGGYLCDFVVGTTDLIYTCLTVDKKVSPGCYTGEVYTYYSSLKTYGSLAVTLVTLSFHCILTVIVLRKASGRTRCSSRERRATITFAYFALTYVGLIILPGSLVVVIDYRDRAAAILLAALQMFVLLSWPTLTTVLLVVRHREVRIGLRALFVCKQMPANLRLWTPQVNDESARRALEQHSGSRSRRGSTVQMINCNP